MGWYEAGGKSAAQTLINKPIGTLWHPGATTTPRIRIREIAVWTVTATSGEIGLCRATARGTNTATQLGVALDSGDPAANGTLDQTYSVDPTMTTGTVIRRGILPATIGAGVVFSWWGQDEGLVVNNNANGVSLFTIVAPSASTSWSYYFCWEE